MAMEIVKCVIELVERFIRELGGNERNGAVRQGVIMKGIHTVGVRLDGNGLWSVLDDFWSRKMKHLTTDK
jgi:hypothetical protein